MYCNFLGDNMNYTFKENQLDYETYYILRKSVKWNNWSKEQAEIALKNSYYTVTVFDNTVAIGMGSAVGDGIYFMIMDIVVKPEYQRMGIGTGLRTHTPSPPRPIGRIIQTAPTK